MAKKAFFTPLIYCIRLVHANKGLFMLRNIQDIKGPKSLPIIGNLHDLKKRSAHITYESWAEEFGEVFKIKVGMKNVIVLSNPELVEECLKARPHKLRRISNLSVLMDEMGMDGVFSAEGDRWKRQRRLLNPVLSPKNIRTLEHHLLRSIERLKQRWKNFADSGTVIEVNQELSRFTVDITCQLIFNKDYNSLEAAEDPLQDKIKFLFTMLMKRIYSLFPHWKYFEFPEDKKLRKVLTEVHEEINKLIVEAKQRIAKNPHPDSLSFLERLIESKDPENPDQSLSEKEIFANVLTLMLAGEDTTANLMSWMSYYLAKDSSFLNVLRDVKGYDPLQLNMKVMDPYKALIFECLRLKSPSISNFCETISDQEIAGYHVPKGTGVMLLTRKTQMNRDNFDHNWEFNPRRWMTRDPNKFSTDHLKTHLAFGGGPRYCPGHSLAMIECQLVANMIAENFELEIADPSIEVEEVQQFLMCPTQVYLRVKHRDFSS